MKVVTVTRIVTHVESCWVPSVDGKRFENDAGVSSIAALANLVTGLWEELRIDMPEFRVALISNSGGAHRARLHNDTPKASVRGESEYDAIGRYVMEHPERFGIKEIVIKYER